MIDQLYYQTWKGELISRGRPATVRPAMPEGLGSANAARKSVDSGLHPHQFHGALGMMAKRIESTAVRNSRF